MKTIFPILSVMVLCACALPGFSQSGYEMKEGETISLDKQGNIINTSRSGQFTSKYNANTVEKPAAEKNSNYNDDGTLKLPGYTPTGNREVDRQNYKKAKYHLFQNNPDEYNKWVEKNKEKTTRVIITYEEFKNLPENKQKIILGQPDKYYIDMSTEYQDCE